MVQFSDSATSSLAPTFRINTTSATVVTFEGCTGCNLSGWGWNDNAYGAGALGPLVYFEHPGMHTIRVQVRGDGLSIRSKVLSPSNYLDMAPGIAKRDTTILPSSP